MKKWQYILFSVVAFLGVGVWLAVSYAVDNVLPYSAIRPYRFVLPDLTPASRGLAFDDFDVVVEDTIRLRGWFVHNSSGPAKGTVILLHGIGSSRVTMLAMAELLSTHGFNAILYDSRANGESGGVNCTFGYYEKHDVSRIIDKAIKIYPGSGPFAIYGSSLGGAVTVQALAIDERLTCGIAECPFASLRQITHDYFKRMFFLPLTSIPDAALARSETIARFTVDSVRPEESAFRVSQPTMIVLGLNDERISVEYGKAVFANIRSHNKIWYPISGAMHNDVFAVGGEKYHQAIIDFFNRNLHN